MLNLVTTLSLGCFDTLNRGGKTVVYENDEGTLIIENTLVTEYRTNTSTYHFYSRDDTGDIIAGIIAYLKNSILKTPSIPVLKLYTNKIKKTI